MDNNINQFRYIYENIELYQFQFSQFDWILFAGVTVGGIVLMIGLFYIFRSIALFTIALYQSGALARKKKTLNDLVLMKDIQTELEKEIEQAVLKAAFHS